MTKKKFNELHKHQGGFKKLKRMMDNLESLEFIGNHFGMTKTGVQFWCNNLWGQNYDPREERKRLKIEAIIEFAEKYPEELFKETFRKESKYYYHIALSECYARGIYKK